MLRRVLTFLTGLLAEMCGWLLLIVMGLIAVDLASRALSRPVYGVSESAMFVMIAIVYLGLPYAEEVKGHVRVEFIIDNLSPRVRAWVELIVYLIVSATMATVLYAVTINAFASMESRQAIAGPTPLVVWPAKMVMVIALTLYVVHLMVHLVAAAQDLLRPDVPLSEDV